MSGETPPPGGADTPVVTPEEKRRQQLRQIRGGCGGCLFVVVVLALFLGGFSGLKQWLRGPALGNTSDLLLIAQPEKHAHAIVGIAAITFMVVLWALSARSMVRGIVQAIVVVAAGVATVGYVCCGRFEAVRPAGAEAVELVFIWPRPNVRFEPKAAVVSIERETGTIGEGAVSLDFLAVEIAGTRYRSAVSGSVEEAKRYLVGRGARWKP